ncbi:MAG: hypothetical protein AB1601_05850 [Planctomycetota bacterium]
MIARTWIVLTIGGLLGTCAAQPAGDALDETLSLVGLKRGDLGWTPKMWWPRWPDVPYKLRAFDALFAEPLDNITYARSLARTAWDKLDPVELNQGATAAGTRTLGGSLFQAVQRLGIDPKFGGFRGYSANTVAPEVPLDQAILKIYEIAGRDTRGFTFGMELPYPRVRERLAEEAKVLPESVSPILGQLVLEIIEAHRWAELAFRKVDARDRQVVATRFNIGEEMIDAVDYCPEFDDVAKTWDEASMWYAAQKCVDALDLARIKLTALPLKELGDFSFDWETPWGWIRVRGCEMPDPARAEGGIRRGGLEISGTDSLLIVDLGGDRRYVGGVAATSATRPISLLLDIMGDDSYVQSPRELAQGAGICGVGILLDASGDDIYDAGWYAQGVGQFGLGLLADLNGNDTYEAVFSAQGCGYFGVGLLLDAFGHDQYRIWADGQGLGGVAGVGVLADRTGNDKYVAERKHSVTGRPSYHSPDLDVAVSNAQGCGMGRRGDGSDGHSWAGGLGALLDGDGDDVYTAGNWALGTGYWFGIGLLHDRAGNDEYHGAVYSQGSGAHFCIGVCIDEAGNDLHLAEENSTCSLAWAHDFTIAILLDAAGDDRYHADGVGLSYSINRSISMLFDLGGNDVYETDVARREREKAGMHPGFAMNAETFRARDGVSTYFAETTSLGLFLDVGGEDKYWDDLTNNARWLDPTDSPNWADRNFSVGVDRPAGRVDFAPTPVRRPSGPHSEPARSSGPSSSNKLPR